LTNEIGKKLAQANGILQLIGEGQNGLDRPIANSVWAACDLIDEAEKAFGELQTVINERNRAAGVGAS